MRKSTIATLIVSIALIILGFCLVGGGIAAGMQTSEYYFGRAVYVEARFASDNLTSRLLTTFGQMTFVLGIAGMFLFAYLAIRNPKPRDDGKKTKEDQDPRQGSQEGPSDPGYFTGDGC